MAKMKGRCTNYDGCEMAENKTIQEADKSNFVCSECGKPLTPIGPITGEPPIPWGVIAVIVAAVLAIGGGAAWYFLGGSDPTPVVVPGPDPKPEPVPGPDPKPEPVQEPEPEPVSVQVPGTYDINLGYATYTGDVKNGKPHGNGTLEFTKAHKIVSTKDYVAQPGDRVVGLFRDGKLQTGKWYQKNGNETIVNY